MRVIWTVSSHWENEWWWWWWWWLLVTESLLWATHLTWVIFIFTNSVVSVLLLPLCFSENGNWGWGKLCNLPKIIEWHVGFNSSSVWLQSWSSLLSCWTATARSQEFKYVVGMDFAETWTESREEGTIKLVDRRVCDLGREAVVIKSYGHNSNEMGGTEWFEVAGRVKNQLSDYKEWWRQYRRLMWLETESAVSVVVCAVLWLMWI